MLLGPIPIPIPIPIPGVGIVTLGIGGGPLIVFDDLLGVASGTTGNPAILVCASRMAPTDRPDIGYAMIFPSATLGKVVVVQIIGLMFLGR